jgi:catechol 2,3-dioxygenase-like lactoylglutathione lyase family enzyme
MLDKSEAYSGFAVDDLDKAREFYGETLGLKVKVLDEENGLLQLDHAGGKTTLCYLKPDLEPGNYTILNFPVDDIDKAVDELAGNGVSFERYDGFDQDDKAIARGLAQNRGPDIAWFKDPAGNILSVLQEE